MSENLPQTFSAWLQLGQKLESEGRAADALGAYDRAILLLRSNPQAREVSDRRAFGVAWMNRGNALQKLSPPAPAPETLRAYDEAIALFETLPLASEPMFRNHLGAAWLNRGHALLVTEDTTAAAESFQHAITVLQSLPLDADPYYRLNLAGAWTNFAHASIAAAPERAIEAARTTMTLVREVERSHEAFASMSLRARRSLVMAIGEVLHRNAKLGVATPDLANEATDAIEDGLALAREFEAQGNPILRPLSARLFQLGTQIYRIHQPQFLAEFVLDTLSLPAFAAEEAFRQTVERALAEALADTQRPVLFVAGTADSDRRRDIAHSLRAAQEQLTLLFGLQASTPRST